ncbi:transcription repressor NadR [Clostridium algidicarnis]|uniref:transcription repressor NadR n=1 Tax=Clostridium algidicarnis TaxID=37659 RepID=UPI001C0CA2B6|nr:transcription repressor NadR [Clostridium algidicarnis]MBU3205194.1 transcription repressor NadR [Clostridium algidicarnis]MBU3213347.1 transcription repressor NadR [Clostridium algidicarnis]MBU3223758.1 transcription repressor NadR [Clostridium algidicarnis]
MNSKDRRQSIEKILLEANNAKKGSELAVTFGVTRQVIVKDVALLRASGINIIATPEGYIIPKIQVDSIRKVIVLSHTKDEIEEELKIIVRFGGVIEDVIVEHPLYGEIKAMLMIKTYEDIKNFLSRFNSSNAQPLSTLTFGVHIHTITAESIEIMDKIMSELRHRGFLILD